MTTRFFRVFAVLIVAALVVGACGDDDGGDEGADAAAGELSGVLGVDAGECGEKGIESGSWFRMVQPGGNPDDGPFVTNGDTPCGDTTWTPLEPGTDGGLKIGEFQPQPEPPFAENGDGAAATITKPQRWFAVAFALATNETDPQTSEKVQPPTIEVTEDGKVTADLRALGVAWNGQHFNQGSPKPDGSLPGATKEVTGTFDEESGEYVLEWTSQIVGGPFNNFIGLWHLEGTLRE